MRVEAPRSDVEVGSNRGVPPHRGPPFRYAMYSRRVMSDFRLPLPLASDDTFSATDWCFRRAPRGQRPPEPDGPLVHEQRCDAPCHAGGIVATVYRGPGGAWLRYPGLATIHVRPDARHADVYLEPVVDERLLGLVLAGPASVFILNQLGQPTLHAGAVATQLGAVGFLGRKGRGKSTMASYFLRRGAALLADDVLLLAPGEGGMRVTPSVPIMKLWSDTVEHGLELADDLPDLAEGVNKKLLDLDGRYAFGQRPVRLAGLYVLDRYDPAIAGHATVSTRQLRGTAAVGVLLAQVSHGAFLSAIEASRFLPFYARVAASTPVRVLSYPDGFAHLELAYRSIFTDLEGD